MAALVDVEYAIYIYKWHIYPSKLKFGERDSFSPGFMTPRFGSHKDVKVNLQFYIGKVSKPIIKHDAPRMFQGDQINVMMIHKNSVSSHTSMRTLMYMRTTA